VRLRFEIVEHPNVPTLAHQQIDDMGADEPGAAGDERAHHDALPAR